MFKGPIDLTQLILSPGRATSAAPHSLLSLRLSNKMIWIWSETWKSLQAETVTSWWAKPNFYLLERSLGCFQNSRVKIDNIAKQCPQLQINQSNLDNADAKQGSSMNSENTDWFTGLEKGHQWHVPADHCFQGWSFWVLLFSPMRDWPSDEGPLHGET